MNFSKEYVEKLKSALSPKRMVHSEGVVRAAIKIASYCLPERIEEIKIAALLHDFAKGYPAELSLKIMESLDGVTEDDLLSPPIYHALIAPTLIRRHFPELATRDVLSAIENHTTGAPDMTLFDEIIFISDYIEEGRLHPSCIKVREFVYDALDNATNREEAIACLHRATIMELDYTINHLVDTGGHLNLRTVATRNAFLRRLPVPFSNLNESAERKIYGKDK